MNYSPKLLKYFHQCVHAGELTGNDDVYSGESGSAEYNDLVRLQMKIHQDQITEMRFLAHAGVATIAAAEWICQNLQHRPLDVARKMTVDHLLHALELPKIKIHNGQRVIHALQNCLEKYDEKKR